MDERDHYADRDLPPLVPPFHTLVVLAGLLAVAGCCGAFGLWWAFPPLGPGD